MCLLSALTILSCVVVASGLDPGLDPGLEPGLDAIGGFASGVLEPIIFFDNKLFAILAVLDTNFVIPDTLLPIPPKKFLIPFVAFDIILCCVSGSSSSDSSSRIFSIICLSCSLASFICLSTLNNPVI